MWKWEIENDVKGVVVIVYNILEYIGRYVYVIMMLR